MRESTPLDAASTPPVTTNGSVRRPQEVLRIAHRAVELRGPDPAAACAAVRSEGAHLVEIDVRVTADEQLVVAHDPWSTGADGTRHWIADLTMDSVVTAGSDIAALETVLEVIRNCGMGVYLDIKSISPNAMSRMSAMLESTGMIGTCIVASSRSDIVGMSATLVPGAVRSVLFASDTEDPVQLAESVRAHHVHPCWERLAAPQRLLSTAWLDRVRDRGLGIITWHEERPDVLADLLQLGVDGICTDDMPLLMASATSSGAEDSAGTGDPA